jgi:hypothetical protein
MCSLVAFWGVCGSRGVTERLQVVEIPRERDIEKKSKHRGIQVGLWTA